MDNQRTIKKITVLGVGNILLKDEGVGVRMIQRLEKKYRFPAHVEPMDGGVLGLNLLAVIAESDRLIVIDAVKNGGKPGDTYRFAFDEIPYSVRTKNSLHQMDLMDALTVVELIAERPETVIVGIEPHDISPWGVELTPPVEASMDKLEAMVMEELRNWGVELTPFEQGTTA